MPPRNAAPRDEQDDQAKKLDGTESKDKSKAYKVRAHIIMGVGKVLKNYLPGDTIRLVRSDETEETISEMLRDHIIEDPDVDEELDPMVEAGYIVREREARARGGRTIGAAAQAEQAKAAEFSGASGVRGPKD